MEEGWRKSQSGREEGKDRISFHTCYMSYVYNAKIVFWGYFLKENQAYGSMVLYFHNVFIRKTVDIFAEKVFICVVLSLSKYAKKYK